MSMDITIAFPGEKKVDAQIGDWKIETGQPKDKGGAGNAPTPFELFWASLATCSGVFAQEFCAARSIPTDNLGLVMRCEQDAKGKRVTKVVFELTLPPEFPEKYRDSIVRSMNMCAVKKHILEPPEFVTEVIQGK